MSSDRDNRDKEKIRCLTILAEAFQYVLQDKRDPSQIIDLLKKVINKPEEAEIPKLKERAIIDDLIRETLKGRLKWSVKISVGGNGENLICQISPSQRCEIYKYGAWFKDSWRQIWFLRLFNGSGHNEEWRDLPISKEDKQFFFSVYQRVKQGNEEKFLDAWEILSDVEKVRILKEELIP